MGKEETLLAIKKAEAEVRALKEAAERDRERILREARREALELRDTLRGKAEERARAILSEAEAAAQIDRERILATGNAEAGRVRARGRGNVEQATAMVLTKVRGALDA